MRVESAAEWGLRPGIIDNGIQYDQPFQGHYDKPLEGSMSAPYDL